MNNRTLATTLLAGASLFALSGAALAQSAIGLAGDKTLVMINAETLSVEGMMEVSGVDMLHGIDRRTADGWVYGIDSENNIVTIDLETGDASVVSTITETISDGAIASVDFNPVADRLRFMGNDGTNLRINADTGETIVDGELHFDDAGYNAGGDQNTVATAYTNSIGSPDETAMYNIDLDMMALVRQTAPNDGTLSVVGPLGIDAAEAIAFDVYSPEVGENIAYLVANMTLYTVDLETGEATDWGMIDGLDVELRDITFLPMGM